MISDLLIAAGLAALAVLVVLVARRTYHAWAQRTWGGDTRAQARYFADTSDGWRLALHRYEAVSPATTRRPLLLVHGIATNSRNFDLDANNSLARWLAQRGHDVWLLDLRGCGASRQPPAAHHIREISFDDFVERDAPAAVARVLGATGTDSVHWIGYSMGGMIGAAALAAGTVSEVASLTMIGSPMAFGSKTLRRHAAWGRMVSAAMGALPLRAHAQRVVPAAGRIDPPWARLVINFANVEPAVIRTAMQVMVEDIPRDLLAQFTHWIRERRGPCSSDGTRDYCGPPQVEVETLLVAGTGDELGPLRSMVEVAAMLGDRAQVHVVGRSARDQAADLSATGARVTVDPTEHEWGHADLIMGREAPARVYEAISAFVAKVDGRDLADGAGGAP